MTKEMMKDDERNDERNFKNETMHFIKIESNFLLYYRVPTLSNIIFATRNPLFLLRFYLSSIIFATFYKPGYPCHIPALSSIMLLRV